MAKDGLLNPIIFTNADSSKRGEHCMPISGRLQSKILAMMVFRDTIGAIVSWTTTNNDDTPATNTDLIMIT